MSIRSRYTGVKREPRQSTDRCVPRSSRGEGLTTKAKNAIKRVAAYIEKNQRDYERKTGDRSSLSNDLATIPFRVIHETGKMGREEIAAIDRMKQRESDEELVRFMSGKGQKKTHQPHSEPTRKKFVVKLQKPRPKPKSRQKEVYLEYDPDAEVER
jgi:hypothetical protein